MSTKNLTANGKIALAPTYALTPAHRDDAGNVHVFVKGLNIWRLVNESAHLFRPDATPPAADDTAPATLNLTRNRQRVSFSTDHADADIVQTSQFLNSAQMVLPLHDYLIDGVHVVASTGPLARQAIREHKAQAEAAAAAAAPAPVEYTPPATWHPGRCFCPKFAPGHTPGLESWGRGYDNECTGDTDVEHDASSCGACIAGATDYRPRIEAGQTWISNQHGTDHQVQGPGDEIGTWAM